jgi:predicted nucleic acid-binding protein
MALFDTDILIDHLKGKKEAKETLLMFRLQENFYSVITFGEILFGMRDSEKIKTSHLIASMKEINVNKDIVTLSYEIKHKNKGYALELYDCIIAATAIIYDLILVTKNHKHYPDKRLKLYVPKY